MALEYTILTPEKVAIHYRLAGLGSRLGAYFIDVLLIFAFGAVIINLIGALAFVSPGIAAFLLYVLVLALPTLYHMIFEALWNGQTLGKKAAGIRVRMADGSPITPGAAMMRNLMRYVDILPGTYTVGILTMFFTEKSQRLGDIVADTVVIHERKNVDKFTVNFPLTAVEHPLEHLVGDLRGMTMEEYLAVKTLCDRYPNLPVGVQSRLVSEVWQPVANRYQIPAYQGVHAVYLMEAVVMKFARKNGLL